MNNILKTLNGVQTHLITWGDPFSCNGQDVIVCITGNPGITDFYIEFASELHKDVGLPVCVIGHAGHEEITYKTSSKLKGQEHLFNLEGQIQHKLDLLSNHINKQSKLHLIGHSIGAWLILELLKSNRKLMARLSSVNLLFPTIQKMAETKNGKYLNNFLRKIHSIVLILLTIAYLVPESIRLVLVGWYLKYKSLPSHYKERILKYFNPNVVEKVLFMAFDEMDNVTSLNTEMIGTVKHLTNVIYSNRDDWVPVHYMEDLLQFQPSLQIREVNLDHAFVLRSSETVAAMVSDFIKMKI